MHRWCAAHRALSLLPRPRIAIPSGTPDHSDNQDEGNCCSQRNADSHSHLLAESLRARESRDQIVVNGSIRLRFWFDPRDNASPGYLALPSPPQLGQRMILWKWRSAIPLGLEMSVHRVVLWQRWHAVLLRFPEPPHRVIVRKRRSSVSSGHISSLFGIGVLRWYSMCCGLYNTAETSGHTYPISPPEMPNSHCHPSPPT